MAHNTAFCCLLFEKLPSCFFFFVCFFLSRKVQGIYGEGIGIVFVSLEKQLCSIGSLVFGAVTKQWKKLE